MGKEQVFRVQGDVSSLVNSWSLPDGFSPRSKILKVAMLSMSFTINPKRFTARKSFCLFDNSLNSFFTSDKCYLTM